MTDLSPTGLEVQNRLQRLCALLEKQQLAATLLFSPDSTLYFSGFETQIESGPAPFALISSALLVTADGDAELFVADSESFVSPLPALMVSPFAAYTVDRPLPGLSDLLAGLAARLERFSGARIGVEMAETPATVFQAIQQLGRRIECVDISPAIRAMRRVKTVHEQRLIRDAVHLAEVGQKAAREHARVGITEVELFGEIHKAMETSVGMRVPVLADILSGSRTAFAGGAPTERRLAAGDLVLIDLAPRLQGYWGDSCNTFSVDGASAAQRRVMDGVERIIAETLPGVRPGMRASELYRSMFSAAEALGPAFRHHGGHGLGTSWHEEPRIVSYNEMVLEAGMVIALEPGVYFEGDYGVRNEVVVAITADGVDVLTEAYR